MEEQVLIIDFGSQYTQVIQRSCASIGIKSKICSSELAEEYIQKMSKLRAIVLSGGDQSVYHEGAPSLPKSIWKKDIAILGICYGAQLMAKEFGGKISNSTSKKEYGLITVTHGHHPLFRNVPEVFDAWASHGDSIEELPPGFDSIAENNSIQGFYSRNRNMFGVQFHPEVTHTVYGQKILSNFLNTIARIKNDWSPENIIRDIQNKAANEIGNAKCILGVSGGVDSTVTAALLKPVLGENLTCLAIDTGGLRKNELVEIKENLHSVGVEPLVDEAAPFFLKDLNGLFRPQEIREAFQKRYAGIFAGVAEIKKANCMIQGTLNTDEIESGKKGKSAMIKTHHNVGIDNGLHQYGPLSQLFKHEVRLLGAELGLPPSINNRHPFPGPGLYIRVLGSSPDHNLGQLVEILREADSVVTDVVRKAGEYENMSQLVVALNTTKTVGLKGDERHEGYFVIVRGVQTVDFMTCSSYPWSFDLMDRIMREVTKLSSITRCMFDVTSKPPGTTEFF